ncbi:MAG TPA: YceI family protein [Acidimicrobiia bacterium]|nr:YceI family protein [Acidimicrobiia bacterium]
MSPTTTSITNPAIRIVGGEELPAAGTYAIDASHSQVGFAVRHMMVSKTRGRFSDFAGTVEIAENPLESSVSVTIQSASIDTRDEQRDGHLRSGDFFDAETWPTLTYQSRSVRQIAKGRYIVEGDLTIKGVTQPVPLELAFEGGGTDPWGGVRLGFSAKTELDREAFGLTWNQALETGGVLVGKKVAIEIEAEAIKQS